MNLQEAIDDVKGFLDYAEPEDQDYPDQYYLGETVWYHTTAIRELLEVAEQYKGLCK